jgi:glucan phosphoethanolaminetransferase (alkaline phosphatase superfamily)
MAKKLYDLTVLIALFFSPFIFLMKSGYEAIGVFFLLSNTLVGTGLYLLEVYHYKEKTSLRNVFAWGGIFCVSIIVMSICSRIFNGSWSVVPKSGAEENGMFFLFFTLLVFAFAIFVSKAFACGRDSLFNPQGAKMGSDEKFKEPN